MARNYPGFLAAFFIILLRVAIGWHFLNEGVEKYESSQHGKEGFSAEIYLRNANGPLAPYFREMVPDVNGRDLLDLTKLKAAWRADVERIADHFKFNEAQRSQADEARRREPSDGPTTGSATPRMPKSGRSISTTWTSRGDRARPERTVVPARTGLGRARRRGGRLAAPLIGSAPRRATGRQSSSSRKTPSAKSRATGRERIAARIRPPAAKPRDPLDPARRDQHRDDLRADRDRGLPDPGVPDPAGGAGRRGVPGHDLPVDASMARPASQPEDRGALLHRQQEPGRADRLPGDRHHAERSLDRTRCGVLRRPAPSSASPAAIEPEPELERQDRPVTEASPDRELDEDHRKPIPID